MTPALLTRMSAPPNSEPTRSARTLISSAPDVGGDRDGFSAGSGDLPRRLFGARQILPEVRTTRAPEAASSSEMPGRYRAILP